MADTKDLYARGLERRKAMFGDADVEKRMAAAGDFGAPLQNVINAYVYGDVWERTGLSAAERSLVMLAITAASNRPAEFRVHAKGALANGCTAAQVQDVLVRSPPRFSARTRRSLRGAPAGPALPASSRRSCPARSSREDCSAHIWPAGRTSGSMPRCAA